MIVEATWFGTTALSLVGLGVIGCCCSDQQLQQQQQQQITVMDDDTDEPKRVCPDCGIENPRDAEYCGDCGFDFTPSGENKDE